MAGRLSHQTFRGLLSVHSRYGLSARGTASRSFPSKASTISLPPSSLRLLPAGAKVAGWELHPLKRDTFARRTLTPFCPKDKTLLMNVPVRIMVTAEQKPRLY